MPGETSGEVMLESTSQEASQVNRQRSAVLREEHILVERSKAPKNIGGRKAGFAR